MGKSFSVTRRTALLAQMNGRCGYCGRPIELEQMHIDHMMPQSVPSLSTLIVDGKKVARTHHDTNLMASCWTCNHYKGACTPEGFRSKMQSLHRRLAGNYLVKVARQFGILDLTPFDGLFYYEKIGKQR